MAKGSEKFAWKLYPGLPRRCSVCGAEPLRVQDVAEERTTYNPQVTRFVCVTCRNAWLESRLEARKAGKAP